MSEVNALEAALMAEGTLSNYHCRLAAPMIMDLLREAGWFLVRAGEGVTADGAAVIDAAHLAHQAEWSAATFGPGARTAGVVDHIRKELVEVEAAPSDLTEWVDVIILAFDGAWRSGAAPQQIIDAIKAKQGENEERDWPDWRTADPDRAIEHVRPERVAGGPPPDTDPELRRTVESWVRGIDAGTWNPTPATKRLLASVLRLWLLSSARPLLVERETER